MNIRIFFQYTGSFLDTVVWMDLKGGNCNIYGCDLSRLLDTEEETSIEDEEKVIDSTKIQSAPP